MHPWTQTLVNRLGDWLQVSFVVVGVIWLVWVIALPLLGF